MENKGERKQVSFGSFLNSFVEGLKKENIDVEFREEDSKAIEWRLLKYDKILRKKLKDCFAEFSVNKFLIVFEEKEKKKCWFNYSLDKVVINIYHLPDTPEFDDKLQTAGGIAKGMSPTIQNESKNGCR